MVQNFYNRTNKTTTFPFISLLSFLLFQVTNKTNLTLLYFTNEPELNGLAQEETAWPSSGKHAIHVLCEGIKTQALTYNNTLTLR